MIIINKIIEKLNQEIKITEEKLQPKKKFSFTKKNNKKDINNPTNNKLR